MTTAIIRPANRNDLDQLEGMISRVDPGMLTMPSSREAMAARIDRHRDERGPQWTTIECPVALADLIPQLQKRLSARETAAQILWLLVGIGLVTLVSGLAHAH